MFARHDLAWLGGEGWRQVLAGAAQEHAPAIRRWQEADWPLVVRRADADGAPGQVALGLALPPRPEDGHKVRISCRVDANEVKRRQAPLPLAQVNLQVNAQLDGQLSAGLSAQADALSNAQPNAQPNAQLNAQPYAQMYPHLENQLRRWNGALAALGSDAAAQGITLRVYGSVALQLLTGQAYLTAGSDIDVLVEPRDRAELAAALALLHTHAPSLPLDGEIVFPGGQAVAWKELAAAQAGAPGTRVLVKTIDRVALARMDTVLATLEEATCMC